MYYRHQITRAAEIESLVVFRDFIKSACQQHPQISGQTVYELQLAVEEASMNVITHGYAGMNPGSIILALELCSDEVVLTLTDFGHPFKPSEPQAPNIETGSDIQPAGRFGLFFIYQSIDEVFYKTSEDSNCLTFIKQL